jgi:hypothetical protein
VPGLELPDGVVPVRLDFATTDPTDDVRVTFSDGRRAYVSAKRQVNKGKPLKDTVKGWIGQASMLGPNDLLVIAGEEFAGPTRHLERALQLHRLALPMESKDEKSGFNVLNELLPSDTRHVVLDRARVMHLQGSTASESFRDHLGSMMDHVVADEQGPQAVRVLADLFHVQAGQALGSSLDDWVEALSNAGLHVIRDHDGPAGVRAAARLAAVAAYREWLRAPAGRIEFSLLADDLEPIVIDDLADDLRIRSETEHWSGGLLHHLRRWRKMLIVGQPGAGKSVALREIAAHCATHPHAPVPLRVMLPRLLEEHPEHWTIETLIDAAAADAVNAEQRAPLAAHLTEEVAHGRAIILCDGLDECRAQAPGVAQRLGDILSALHTGIGFVLATRASGQRAAKRLNLPQVELEPPAHLRATLDRILAACAVERLAETEHQAWLAARRAWLSDAESEHRDLLKVPLLAILLALVCADASDVELPKGRAALLHKAVKGSIERWEQARGTLDPDLPQFPELSAGTLLDGYIVLGRLLDAGATPTNDDALAALFQMLRDPDEWALPPAKAREVAQEVLRFWDEHVAVFVMNQAGELTARSRVFAEIATAMWTTKCQPGELTAWLTDALTYSDSDGAIALAADLDSRTMSALLDVGARGKVDATLMAADLSVRGIGVLDDQELERILQLLHAGVASSLDGEEPVRRGPKVPSPELPLLGDEIRPPGPWPFVEAACLLALPEECRRQREALVELAALNESSAKIAAALCALTDATTDGRPLGDLGAAAVNNALAIPVPEDFPPTPESRKSYPTVGHPQLPPGIDQVALGAATRLDELAASAGARAIKISKDASGRMADRINNTLARAGFDMGRNWGNQGPDLGKWREERKRQRTILLADISALAEPNSMNPTPLGDSGGLWSLPDIGDLIAATRYGVVAAVESDLAFTHDSAETRRAWLSALADAFGIDKSAAADQARYIQRMNEQADENKTASEDWYVAHAQVLVAPSLRGDLDTTLTAEQKRKLLACVEAQSGWIAWAAANVLVHLREGPWDSEELLARDMSGWNRRRAGLFYAVAILTAGPERQTLAARGVSSDSADQRFAVGLAISVDPALDPDGGLMEALRGDADRSVRPDEARNQPPAPSHWSCDKCRALNNIDAPSCHECGGLPRSSV